MTPVYDTSVRHDVILSVRLHPEIKLRAMARAFSEHTDLSAVIKKFLSRYAAGFKGEIKATEPTSDKKKLSEEVGSKVSPERTISSSEPSAEAFVLARCLSSLILRNNPKAKVHLEPTIRRWAHVADLIHGRDGRTWEDMGFLLEWSQNDTFWWKNILSMEKFREKFDQLWAKSPFLAAKVFSLPIKENENPKWYGQHQMNPKIAGEWAGEKGCVCPECTQLRGGQTA